MDIRAIIQTIRKLMYSIIIEQLKNNSNGSGLNEKSAPILEWWERRSTSP